MGTPHLALVVRLVVGQVCHTCAGLAQPFGVGTLPHADQADGGVEGLA
jgi:hypothetical protein